MTLAAEAFSTADDEIVTMAPVGSTERYRLGEMLGEGGMGEVRLCEDQRLRRQVAMKVMRQDRARQPALRARFFREVIAQGQLEHPAIVPVHDLGTDEKGSLYFTMRRVVGATLEEVVLALQSKNAEAERQYSRHKLLTAFGNACLAIHYAHTRSVFHCDLKPANIMLGAYGEVYVLDWGLAVRVERSGVSSAAQRTPGRGESTTVNGTPGYMAPEQIRGQALDARADVYGLGSILFELLTLTPLHSGNDPRELCVATLSGSDARTSVRAPDRDVPPELEAICVKATALDPRRRYATARALYDDLERYLEGDRDLHLRRTMSNEHATRAAKLAARSRHGDEATRSETRSEAMQTVGRALALDPENLAALGTLIELLTEPPREMPQEALEEMKKTERSFERVRNRAGAIAFVAWVAFIPLMLAHGIHSWTMFVVATAAWLGAAAANLYFLRNPRRDGYTSSVLVVFSGIAIATSSFILGPSILAPTLAAVYALTTSLAMDARRRFLPMVMGCLAIAVPWALERLHVLPASTVFHDGMWSFTPMMLDFPKRANGALFVVNLACVVGACYIGMAFRSLLTDVQKRAHTNAWQLRQLLPKAPSSARPSVPSRPLSP